MRIFIAFLCLISCSFGFAQSLPSYVPANCLVAWYPFNGNANDESGNGYHGMIYGATLTTDRNGSPNSAFNFSYLNWTWGSGGDYIYIPYNSAFSSSTVTVSIWAYRVSNGYPSEGQRPIARYDGGYSNPNGQAWQIGLPSNTNEIYSAIYAPSNTNSQSQMLNKGPVLAINEWTNIVFSFDGNHLRQYINGVLVADSSSANFSLNTAGNSGISIGLSVQANGHWHPFDGKLDDVGIWNRALSQQEISNLYNASLPSACPSLPTNLQTGLVGYWPFCGNANDESGNGNNGTVNGASLTNDRNGNSNSAYLFDGSDYIRVPHSSSLNFGSGSFTLSAWALCNGSNQWQHLITKLDYPSFSQAKTIYLRYTQNAIEYVSSVNQINKFYNLSPGIQKNQWHHITGIYDSLVDSAFIYIDGIKVSSVPAIQNINVDNLADMLFGVEHATISLPSGPNYFSGIIDDVAIWNRALSKQEVTQLYNSSPCPEINSLFPQDTIRACGAAYTLDAGSGYSNYSWNTGAVTQSINVTSTGWYKCTVTQGGCTGTDSVFVSLVNANIINNDTSVCKGSSIQLSLQSPCNSLNNNSTSWQLLIPGSNIPSDGLNVRPFSFDRDRQILYSAYSNGTLNRLQKFDLRTNSVIQIPASGWFGRLDECTYDHENNRIIASRSGRDVVYSIPVGGGSWTVIGSGSVDNESYGGMYFWNSITHRPAFFGGYGFFAVKNWIWENNGSGWLNTRANLSDCQPAKRGGWGMRAAGSGYKKYYLFSGQGSCDGNQGASSCSLGSPWPTDVGVYCWLRDLWELDLATYQFTNILPVNNQTINREGAFAFDYTSNTFYNIGGRAPTSSFNVYTSYSMDVARFRRGVDQGFSNITVSGTPPPADRDGVGIYDSIGNRIIYARNDGIWAINLGGSCSLTYLWSTGDTTPSITVAPTQTTTYYVTVSNGISSCTDSVTVTVNNIADNLFVQDTIRACGAAYTLDAGSGYDSYNWNTGATTQSIDVTSSGWYKCTVTQGECSGFDSVYVDLLNVNIQQNDTAICQGDGILLSAQVNGSSSGSARQLVDQFTMTFGGPYSRSLNTVIGDTYSMTVSGVWAVHCDSWGQMDAAYAFNQPNLANPSFMVWNGLQIRPTPDVYNPSHVYNYNNLVATQPTQYFNFYDNPYGDNCGSLNFSIYRMSPSYSFIWSTGATTPSITVSPTQTTTYYVTVSNGISSCLDSVTVFVNQPTTSNQSVSGCSTYQWNGETYAQSGTYTWRGVNASGCDSLAILNLTLNTPTFSSQAVTACTGFVWNGNTYSVSGIYSYLSTNINSCDSTAVLILTITGNPVVRTNATPILCDGGTTSIEVTASGGTPGYTGTGSFIRPAGSYTFAVTDANGCQGTASITVTQPAQLMLTITTVSATSTQSNGSATAIVSGGTPPYSYFWSNGATTAIASNLVAGNYSVTVKDANNCSVSASATVGSINTCTGFKTFAQSAWGAPRASSTAAAYIKQKFSSYFRRPAYLTIGCATGNKLRITSYNALDNFLPSTGPIAILPSGTITNPGNTYSNSLAGELVALTLNMICDYSDPVFSPSGTFLKDLIVASGPFAGFTVQQVLDEANRFIGNCPSSFTATQIYNAVRAINLNFENGTVDRGYLICPATYLKVNANQENNKSESGADINVYPNPSKGDFNVAVRLSKPEKLSLVLYDISGRKIIEKYYGERSKGEWILKFNSGELQLSSGVYLLVIKEGDIIRNRRVVISR